MISFGLMSGLLVIIACILHFDLFGLFPTYLSRQQTTSKLHEPKTVLDFQDSHWIPLRSGTDPNIAYSTRSTIFLYDDNDYDDFWTQVVNADDDDDDDDDDDHDDDDDDHDDDDTTAGAACIDESGDNTVTSTCTVDGFHDKFEQNDQHNAHVASAGVPQFLSLSDDEEYDDVDIKQNDDVF